GAEISLRALELGAVDVLAKPKVDVEQGLRAISTEIVDRVKAAATARPRWKPAAGLPARAAEAAPTTSRPSASGTFAVSPSLRALGPARPGAAHAATANVFIAIGASTGGTEAIYEVLKGFPEDAPGTVMVQHMPPGFTKAFAQRLDRSCKVRVKEAEDGDAIQPGHVLLAPGDRHMTVERASGHWVVRLSDGPPVGYHKPAVDVLFESCARSMGASAVAVLLTGMGMDGAGGMLAMRRAGSHTVAQDEATSVVYGMPREAAARGAAESVEPLSQISATVLRWCAELRRSGGKAAA
ncbi:MAG: chemotaxis-specific protein-glutamate methyltransferase CheB, partial [Candidatus Eisenbacteria bacterium]